MTYIMARIIHTMNIVVTYFIKIYVFLVNKNVLFI